SYLNFPTHSPKFSTSLTLTNCLPLSLFLSLSLSLSLFDELSLSLQKKNWRFNSRVRERINGINNRVRENESIEVPNLIEDKSGNFGGGSNLGVEGAAI
ncbi:hypothetical protein GIB67_021323, partial [Kingdonia uniflora]